jgi:hypothetical protein
MSHGRGSILSLIDASETRQTRLAVASRRCRSHIKQRSGSDDSSLMSARSTTLRFSLFAALAAAAGCGFSSNATTNPGTAGTIALGGRGGTTGITDGGADVPPPRGDYTIGTPANPGAWTSVPVVDAMAPAIVYPSNETRFPRNIYRTLFQWLNGGYTQFRLTFKGPGTTVTVYTDGVHTQCAARRDAACWEADENSWWLIAGGNAGQTVTWTVDGLDASTQPATIRRSASITIGFSAQDVQGAIFYWSTTSAGIRRANVSAAEPEDYITGKPGTVYDNPADKVGCVACHVVSRDGKYMAAPVSAQSGNSLWIMEVTRAAPPNPLVKQIPNTGGHGFPTISPDDAHVVAAWKGKMWMLDRATGATQGDLPLGTIKATHPDWSPDNSQLVFATAEGDAPRGANLAVIPWANGAWGQPKTIVGPTTGLTNLFPMFSPSGAWIAFSRGSKGGHGDLTAQLWIAGKGGEMPVELINANRIVSNKMGDGQNSNTQPTWAPPGDYHWVAFNSMREYGVVLPKGRQQLWVAAVDVSKLGQAGVDPSYPAFRLQFQGLNEDNHRAYWTLDVRDKPRIPQDPTPDGGVCIAQYAACDPTRDSCCNALDRCDTKDDGATYTCEPIIVQ